MKATEANLLKFLKNAPQFIIPIYQRNYSWTQAQCQQLFLRQCLQFGFQFSKRSWF